jgi:glycosyltransferase involved in cell wall biosynthesis
MAKTKRVLFLFNATTHYYNLVLNRLDRQSDYEIHIAVPAGKDRNVGPGVFQTEDNLKIPIYHLNEVQSKRFGCHFPDLWKLLWKVKPDIIVSLEYYQKGLFLYPASLFSLKALGIKIILKTIPFQMPNYRSPIAIVQDFLGKNGLSFKDFWIQRNTIVRLYMDRFFYSRCYNAFVCYVEKAYEIFPTYGVNPKSIFITYNSPDTDTLLELNEKAKSLPDLLPANPHRLIHVGRLVEWKRVDLIIEAVANLKNEFPNTELIVIGNGPMKEEWQSCAEKNGVLNSIQFIGGIYDLLVLGQYFRASSIYVLGGMGGLSINDAMSFERPILCSECDGTEVKLVRDGFNGHYFKNGDALDLTRKIEKLFRDPKKIKEMGANSHAIIKNEINIHRVIEGYTKAFEYAHHN